MKIDFQLLGTKISPKEITAIVGIAPDTELLRGERNSSLNLPRQNIWSLESHSNSDAVGEHWSCLENDLTKAKEKIREVAKTGRAKMTVVVESGERIPSIRIPASMSEFAGFVGAEIDIDHLQ